MNFVVTVLAFALTCLNLVGCSGILQIPESTVNIVSIDPAFGSSRSLTKMMLTGTGLQDVAQVTVGNQTCTGLTILDSTSLQCSSVPTLGINSLTLQKQNGEVISPVPTFNAYPSDWLPADGGGTLGINFQNTKDVNAARLNSFQGKLYASWGEQSMLKAHVAVFNGNLASPVWKFVDGNNVNGLNYDPTETLGGEIVLLTSQKASALLATWDEFSTANNAYEVRVSLYNGDDNNPSWNFLNGANGLNYDPFQDARNPRLVEVAGSIYAVWSETTGGIYQVRAAKFNGNFTSPAWSFVDGGASTTIINRNNTKQATDVEAAALNGKLYIAWSEANALDRVHVSVYNGNDSSPSYLSVDPPSGFSQDSSLAAEVVSFFSFEGRLYIFWGEGSWPNYNYWGAVYNNNDASPAWNLILGSGLNGLATASGSFGLTAAGFNSFIYAGWSDATQNLRLYRFRPENPELGWVLTNPANSNAMNYVSGIDPSELCMAATDKGLYIGWIEWLGAVGAYQFRVRGAQ